MTSTFSRIQVRPLQTPNNTKLKGFLKQIFKEALKVKRKNEFSEFYILEV
jgi:hypothetical protein